MILAAGDESAVTGNEVYFLGDSITFGQAATSFNDRYSALLCAEKNWIEVNQGVPSRGMSNGGAQPNFIDVYLTETPSKGSDGRYLLYNFIINDVYYLSTTAEFKLDYTTCINHALTLGWTVDDIKLVNGCYITSSRQADVPQFNIAMSELGSTFGIEVIDIWDYMINNGGASLVSGDTLHPNNAGHAAIAQSLSDNLT